MYAIAEIAGKQFKVSANQKVYIPLQKANENDTLTFDQVLLVAGDDGIKVGTPLVSGASVSAKVLGHIKADKVYIFKKKRRKRYKVKRGHRQQYTQVVIEGVSLS